MSPINYTQYGYRINTLSQNLGYTWLLFPGGPGLGSEYLIEFSQKMQLPGTVLLIDFPLDGTNEKGVLDLKHWQDGLIDLVTIYPNSILVTHSFSGMFVLNMPEIESHIAGLVLMNTTTQNSFFEHTRAMQEQHHLPDLVPDASAYHLNPSRETYQAFWHTYKHYCFTPEELSQGEEMIRIFAFNNDAYYFAIQHFYANYRCKLSPQSIPVMTLSSEQDFICPPKIFMQNPQFQATHVINKMISKAGHCPWLMQEQQVKSCFDEFIKKLL